MDYKKAYNEALEKARQLCTYPTSKPFISDLQNLFPELAESDDGETKKSLMQYIWNIYHREYCPPTPSIETCDKWLAWLEKQGNQREQLINKACDILVNCIEDYMLRRMEVWSEDCKNQTLENIRKKLEE